MPRRGMGSKANRTDLLTPAVSPGPQGQPNGVTTGKIDGVPRVATGLPYGEHQALQQGLEQVPTPAPGNPPDIAAAMQRTGWQMPNLTPLDAPTQRPNEHVTTGNIGTPGATPVSRVASIGFGDVAPLLSQLAQITGNPDLQSLAETAKGS